MKRMTSLVLALLMICTLAAAIPVRAEDAPAESANLGAQNYVGYAEHWAAPVRSHLHAVEDGFERIEYLPGEDGRIVIERYDSALRFQSRKELEAELPLYGGIFCGAAYHYAVFGQENPEENDALEVIRVVRYDRDWNRMDDVRLSGINTTVPFDAGSLRMAEVGSRLYIRTSHEMYAYEGVNHQANLQILIDTADMKLLDTFHEIWNIESGYVSHSFNQFGIADGTDYVTADHGDGAPRAVVLCRYPNADQQTTLPDRVESVQVLSIVGQEGDNATGVCVGGLEASDTAYLLAGTSVEQVPGADPDHDPRGIFVTATSKTDFTEHGTAFRWITEPGSADVSVPHLVKLDANSFLLLWTEGRDQLRWVLLDGSGAPVSELYRGTGNLSDCVPIVTGNRVLWYYTDHSVPQFLEWNRSQPGRVRDPRDPIFTDVSESDYFYEPVLWAVENGVTAGVAPDRFGPEELCARGQIMTFLWNAMGKPQPQSQENPFSDLSETDYFYTPVLWAVEQGVTSGVGGGRFGPEQACTRGQIVTFLWNALDRPQPQSQENPFRDLSETDYFYTPVLWAVENGITSGMGNGCFGPEEVCTRAQAVTFLWRAFAD